MFVSSPGCARTTDRDGRVFVSSLRTVWRDLCREYNDGELRRDRVCRLDSLGRCPNVCGVIARNVCGCELVRASLPIVGGGTMLSRGQR